MKFSEAKRFSHVKSQQTSNIRNGTDPLNEILKPKNKNDLPQIKRKSSFGMLGKIPSNADFKAAPSGLLPGLVNKPSHK
jgi:hypothetical protein